MDVAAEIEKVDELLRLNYALRVANPRLDRSAASIGSGKDEIDSLLESRFLLMQIREIDGECNTR